MKNKIIKIVAIIALLFVLCFTLSACDPSPYNFKSEDLAEVISIELINYDNPEQKHFSSWVPNHTSDLKKFDFKKMNHLETLDQSGISAFADDLCDCEILYKYFAYDSPSGICIKLNYFNGDFLIVQSDYETGSFIGYIGKFNIYGEVADFIGCFESLSSYKRLVNNYFSTQI